MPIRAIPALDWILLTKGPQNIVGMLPVDWGEGWPNVWLGTTTENQIEAARRIPHLVAIPAAVRFLSVEPMLKAIDLSPWLGELSCAIVGGESGIGKRARAMHPDWLRALRDQLQAAGVAMFVKRVGSNRAAWPGIRLSGRPICAFRIYRGKLPARHEAAMPHNTSYRAPRRPLDAGRSAVPSTPAGSPPGFRASKQVQSTRTAAQADGGKIGGGSQGAATNRAPARRRSRHPARPPAASSHEHPRPAAGTEAEVTTAPPGDSTCVWCGTSFSPRLTGGTAQRFCRPTCRRGLDAAGRRWVADAVATGVLTIGAIRDGCPAARALPSGADSPAEVPQPLPAPSGRGGSSCEAAALLHELLSVPSASWQELADTMPQRLFDALKAWHVGYLAKDPSSAHLF
jgi:hypothetical protein